MGNSSAKQVERLLARLAAHDPSARAELIALTHERLLLLPRKLLGRFPQARARHEATSMPPREQGPVAVLVRRRPCGCGRPPRPSRIKAGTTYFMAVLARRYSGERSR
jgi:hypothetical protein